MTGRGADGALGAAAGPADRRMGRAVVGIAVIGLDDRRLPVDDGLDSHRSPWTNLCKVD
jgi:hypothetical protein